jgi:hypothetical protein
MMRDIMRLGLGVDHDDEFPEELRTGREHLADFSQGTAQPFLMELGKLPNSTGLGLTSQDFLSTGEKIHNSERGLVDYQSASKPSGIGEAPFSPAWGSGKKAQENKGVGRQA